MLWVKALHIVFVTSWFAGLFYLPRIFVNLALLDAGAPAAERHRLLLMAHKLYRFMGPLMVLAIALGFWLWAEGVGVAAGSKWLFAKLLIVLLLLGYHFHCGLLLSAFAAGENRRTHTWYRLYNEIPVVALLLVVILVVVKPF